MGGPRERSHRAVLAVRCLRANGPDALAAVEKFPLRTERADARQQRVRLQAATLRERSLGCRCAVLRRLARPGLFACRHGDVLAATKVGRRVPAPGMASRTSVSIAKCRRRDAPTHLNTSGLFLLCCHL